MTIFQKQLSFQENLKKHSLKIKEDNCLEQDQVVISNN